MPQEETRSHGRITLSASCRVLSTENAYVAGDTPGAIRSTARTEQAASNAPDTAVGRGGQAPTLLWAHWPRLDYASGLALQHRLMAGRRRKEIPDLLVVTEHPATITLGRRGSRADLRVRPSELAARGIALYRVGRGGHATFHGPGQLVVYPIVDLRSLRIGPRRFVETIEGAAVQVLRAIGVEAEGGKVEPGVWVGDRKIGALGIEILGGISRHGLSLNLSGELDPFDLIVQCGASTVRAVTVDALGISPPHPIQVAAALADELGRTLGLRPRKADAQGLLGKAGKTPNGRSVGLADPGEHGKMPRRQERTAFR